MITVSSCGIKLQEVLSLLGKKDKTLDIHMHFLNILQNNEESSVEVVSLAMTTKEATHPTMTIWLP